MRTQRQKIAILHYSSPPVIGGVEFVIEAHAKLFADAGYDTRLIVGKGGKLQPSIRTVVIPEISSTGGPISDIVQKLQNGVVPVSFDKYVIRVEKKLRAALKDVDVCMMHNVLTMHFNLVLTAALARIMEHPGNTRFIGWTHDSTFGDSHYIKHQRTDYPWSLLSKKLTGCRYCVISAHQQQEMSRILKIPAEKLPVIPDGIKTTSLLRMTPHVAKIFDSEHLSDIDIVALTPTRIVRRKNLETGIKIVAAMKSQGKSIRWMITGAPDPHNRDSMDYYNKLLRLCKRLDVEKEVMFLCERFDNRVSNEDLRALFNISDMLIFPSKREGFGIPILEAGVAGLLLLVNDIPALRELCGKSAVYITDEDALDDVARRALLAIKSNPILAFRKKVITNYSWMTIFLDKILPAITDPGSVWKKKNQQSASAEICKYGSQVVRHEKAIT